MTLCVGCGREFEPRRADAKACSGACRAAASRRHRAPAAESAPCASVRFADEGTASESSAPAQAPQEARAGLTILEALADPLLFGALPAFRDLATWRPWLAFLRAVYGLPMDEADLALFREHTGRETPRAGGYPEAVAVVGCQSGKSQIAALVGVFEAAHAVTAGQRGVFVPLIAQDLRGAQRALLCYVREAVESSAVLRGDVQRSTAAPWSWRAV